jgi:hypothetical protein
MEADAERVRRLAGGEQQLLHLARLRAELGSEAELGMIGRDADAHAQVEVVARLRWRSRDDLLELVHRVEREGAHAVREIGLGDRFLGLHRVHEAERRLRQRLARPAAPRRSRPRRNA